VKRDVLSSWLCDPHLFLSFRNFIFNILLKKLSNRNTKNSKNLFFKQIKFSNCSCFKRLIIQHEHFSIIKINIKAKNRLNFINGAHSFTAM